MSTKESSSEERFYTIPLKRAWIAPFPERAPKAIRVLKNFLRRNLKTDNFKIDESLNKLIWGRGIEKPPRKVRVRIVKKDDLYVVYPLKAEVEGESEGGES
ncbi:MAG: 60S ribosomal protein L31 [Candidatus Bathyarchaeota archaeon]|nr:60S ribosomal protein L31 [Candidatus Bathyarchaeota archaeon]